MKWASIEYFRPLRAFLILLSSRTFDSLNRLLFAEENLLYFEVFQSFPPKFGILLSYPFVIQIKTPEELLCLAKRRKLRDGLRKESKEWRVKILF